MANFKKTIATARERVAKTEIEAFKAGLEAIYAILQDASPHDVLTLCACPRGCRAELLRGTLGQVQAGVSAGAGRLHRHPASPQEADENDDPHRQVH